MILNDKFTTPLGFVRAAAAAQQAGSSPAVAPTGASAPLLPRSDSAAEAAAGVPRGCSLLAALRCCCGRSASLRPRPSSTSLFYDDTPPEVVKKRQLQAWAELRQAWEGRDPGR